MNLLVVIFIILMIFKIYRGFKNGFAKEVNGLVSLFMALIVLSIALLLLAGIIEKNAKIIVVSTVMLIVVSFIHRLVNMLMKSIETISKLPLINLVNMLLGAAAGALKILVVFWIIYVIIGNFPTGKLGEQMMTWTEQSAIMINVYNKNYIAHWIMGLKL